MAVLKIISVVMYFYVLNLSKAGGISLDGIKREKAGILTQRLSKTGPIETDIVLSKGNKLKMECEFPAEPWSYIQWVKQNYPDGSGVSVITGNETFNNGSLLVSSVVLEEVESNDAGNYSCVSTRIGASTAFKFMVAIKDRAYCEESLCGVHGVCQELFHGYSCDCDGGYIGKHCEKPDYCFGNPCLNNGSCTTLGDGFNCTCPEEFAGEKCERETCTRTSCNGGGSCTETAGGTIKCSCRNDRAGERCQHRCTFVSGRCSYYRWHRICLISASGYERCRCNEDGYTSRHCMMESDIRNECRDPNICNGRGRCQELTYKYKCNCYSYASGKNCEFYDECSSGQNLCNTYGGRCINLPQGYKCINCPSGQRGDKCQYKDNPCTVRCMQTSMTAECDMRFLSKNLRKVPIYLNWKHCSFDNRYSRYGNSRHSKTINYDSCGTEVEQGEDYIIYRNSLRSGAPNGKEGESDIISRNSGHFSFKMECKIPLQSNVSSHGLTDNTLPKNDTTDLQDRNEISIPTTIEFYKENWQGISSYVVGDRIYVKMSASVSNQKLSSDGMLKPVTCFATPDENGNTTRYYLLQDGCIKDDSFRTEQGPRNYGRRFWDAYFSFQSFTFKSNPGHMYLHCDSRFFINCVQHTTPYPELFGKRRKDSSSCEVKCGDGKDSESATTVPSATPALLTRVKRSLEANDMILGAESQHDLINWSSGLVVEPSEGKAFA